MQSISYKHIGIYAYKKSFLSEYCSYGTSDLEKQESLEQLRTLYLGEKIQVQIVENDLIGVDHPEDVFEVEKILDQRNKL